MSGKYLQTQSIFARESEKNNHFGPKFLGVNSDSSRKLTEDSHLQGAFLSNDFDTQKLIILFIVCFTCSTVDPSNI